MSQIPIRRALISVSDKTHLVDFARQLQANGVEILSTGGTARLLLEQGIEAVEVADYTGFPEIMSGRVKTLHPKIHGGLLGRRGLDDEVMTANAIAPIDLLVVNLYPFAATIADPNCDLATAIENIDIGGPAMLRAGAKNHAAVTVVVDPADYPAVIDALQRGGSDAALRFRLATKAFAHTARYDGTVANYLSGIETPEHAHFPNSFNLQFERSEVLRYGENPHQRAALYREPTPVAGSVAFAQQLQGKALSFNNIADTDAALACVSSFQQPACVIVKHANPCGVAVAESPFSAYELAFKTDPTSAFGGIIAFNRPLEGTLAKAILERQFVEVIIAPSVTEEAASALQAKPNVRLLACGELTSEAQGGLDYRRIVGGLLVQDSDSANIDRQQLVTVTQRAPSEQELDDLLFAWRVAKFVKSNAIVYARGGATLGIGAGQMSRVYSAKIAALKASDEGLAVTGAVMASDAFFPFRDGIDAAADAGIRAVIQPGGSMRDNEVISAADEHGIAMVFTGLRHFRH